MMDDETGRHTPISITHTQQGDTHPTGRDTPISMPKFVDIQTPTASSMMKQDTLKPKP